MALAISPRAKYIDLVRNLCDLIRSEKAAQTISCDFGNGFTGYVLS